MHGLVDSGNQVGFRPSGSRHDAPALFGLFAYATNDLSNLATLRGWPLRLALVDMACGARRSPPPPLQRAAGRWALGRMA